MEPAPAPRNPLQGRAITLPLAGIDANAAIGVLTVHALRGEITHDLAQNCAALIRAASRGERLPEPVAELVSAAALLLCGGGR